MIRFFSFSISLYNIVLIFANIFAITYFKIDTSRLNENGYLHNYIFWGIDVINKSYDSNDANFLKVLLFYSFLISQFFILGCLIYFSFSELIKLYRGVFRFTFNIGRATIINLIFALVITYLSSKTTIVIKILGLGGNQIFCFL